ncbi:hypothetical protein PCN061_3775 [Escherichia coli PCN061]|uniref:Uncharacterized protein n=1 Tax=Escherichia coli TaxID=562 RepID=A0A2H4TT82_ECOLX|nr:hypothetical protein PCN061_3775 [Escherichia coli PCN061]ALD77390.1 hypothetical protein P10159_2599 [Citrobacter portucalensis]ATZ32753.1 hypothetical protein CV83915_02442 [Escherichia coli]
MVRLRLSACHPIPILIVGYFFSFNGSLCAFLCAKTLTNPNNTLIKLYI